MENAVRPLDAPRCRSPLAAATRSASDPVGIGAGVWSSSALGGLLVWRAESKTNKVALASDAEAGDRRRRAGDATSARRARTSGRSSPGSRPTSARSSSRPTSTRCSCARARSSSAARCSRRSTAATRARRARRSPQARAIDARQKAVAHESARVQDPARRRLRVAERGRAEAGPERRGGGAARVPEGEARGDAASR